MKLLELCNNDLIQRQDFLEAVQLVLAKYIDKLESHKQKGTSSIVSVNPLRTIFVSSAGKQRAKTEDIIKP